MQVGAWVGKECSGGWSDGCSSALSNHMIMIVELQALVVGMLADAKLEVREMAATTLSGALAAPPAMLGFLLSLCLFAACAP